MKVAILAGGTGSRLSEETVAKPKPMVEIGGRPILWHIMKHYAHFGFDDFTIALGYKGEYIKRYFTDYAHLEKNLTISLSQGRVEWLDSDQGHENWTVRLIDTGFATMTGGRERSAMMLVWVRRLRAGRRGMRDAERSRARVRESYRRHQGQTTPVVSLMMQLAVAAARSPLAPGAGSGDSIEASRRRPA